MAACCCDPDNGPYGVHPAKTAPLDAERSLHGAAETGVDTTRWLPELKIRGRRPPRRIRLRRAWNPPKGSVLQMAPETIRTGAYTSRRSRFWIPTFSVLRRCRGRRRRNAVAAHRAGGLHPADTGFGNAKDPARPSLSSRSMGAGHLEGSGSIMLETGRMATCCRRPRKRSRRGHTRPPRLRS